MQSAFIKPKGQYFLAHSVGPLTHAAKRASADYMQQWQDHGGDAWPLWLDSIDKFRQSLASLLNVEASQICPQTTVSAAFTQWLSALCKLKNDKQNTVVMHESAFPSLGFVVNGLSQHGLQLKLVSGEINAESTWLPELASKQCLAVLFTHVHSNTGELSHIETLSRMAKHYGVYVAVDIAQSLSIVPIDAKQWHVDAIVGSCVKWSSGGPGAGFIALKQNVTLLEPDHVGWFSHQNPFEFNIRHFVPSEDALRFLGGTPSVQPFVSAQASLSSIEHIGINNLNKHTKQLQAHFLRHYAMPVDIDIDSIGGTLCLPFNGDKTKLDELCKQAQLKLDQRGNVIRLSFHAIHQLDEVENLARWLSRLS